MSYQFFDANTSILSADSSVISGNVLRPTVDIGSVLSAVPVSFSGSPSISGAVTIVGIPSVSGTVNIGNNVSVSGTVNIGGTPSISGALMEMGNLNITMASVLANSTVPIAVGGFGEQVVANAPFTQWVQGNASCFTGVIQPVITAQGTSVFTYVTSAQVTNASANNVYLTIYGATSSVVSYLPVPANSGAIPLMINGWKSNANGAFSASVSGVSSVYLAFQGFISKT